MQRWCTWVIRCRLLFLCFSGFCLSCSIVCNLSILSLVRAHTEIHKQGQALTRKVIWVRQHATNRRAGSVKNKQRPPQVRSERARYCKTWLPFKRKASFALLFFSFSLPFLMFSLVLDVWSRFRLCVCVGGRGDLWWMSDAAEICCWL